MKLFFTMKICKPITIWACAINFKTMCHCAMRRAIFKIAEIYIQYGSVPLCYKFLKKHRIKKKIIQK